ncbi:MAG: hypothetical protein R6U16_12145 [Desulfotignum sp.]
MGYKPQNAILDHFFMIALLILILIDKKQKITNALRIRHHELYYLLVKIKINACNAGLILVKYCKYSDEFGYIYNTLSGGAGTYGQNTRPEADFSLSGKQMLDDPTTGRANELLYPFGSAVPGQNRLLQQFFPQWEMVHPGLDSPFQQQGPVVLPGYRIFKTWSAYPYAGESGREKYIGDDSRSTGAVASMPLPCRSGSIIPQGAAAKTKARWFLCVLGHRSSQGRCSGKSASNGPYTFAGGVGGPDPCGIYPESRFGFETAGQICFSKNRDADQHRADSNAFRCTRGKKKGLNSGAKAWLALSQDLTRLYHDTLPGALFPKPPDVRFRPEENRCSCGRTLFVQKTRRKTVFSMTGPFKAHETLYHCRTCRQVYRSGDLLNIVARCCNVAWNVLVFVGKSLFQRCLTTDEVCHELKLRNIGLSPSEVEYLGRKFILYLALAHRQATPRIEQAMNRSGGYILHLDATHEGDAPVLMTGMDGLKQIVLGNVKIPSEHADHIVPFLEQLQKNYGTPIACVHDMGTGLCKAVYLVFPGIRDFVCHFHFLRDAGKDLLEPSYGQLRKTLQKHAATTKLGEIIRDLHRRIENHALDTRHLTAAITKGHALENMNLTSLASIYSLCLWCLQGKKEGNGYGFPFDRPLLAFARRIAELKDSLPSMQKKASRDRFGKRLFGKLNNLTKDLCNDPDFIRSIDDLEWRTLLFDDLREKMRIADPSGRNGLNDEGSHKAMNSIQKAVGQFRSKLEKNTTYKKDLLCRKLAKQIDKYDERLFADPIEVDTPTGKITIHPQRTNNLLEQFFRSLRRDHRRKTGNNSMRRVLHAMLADTPLIKNLENPEYMNLLLNGKKNLEELFADLEINGHEPISSTSHPDRVLPGFRKLIKMDDLPGKIQMALEKCS